MLEHGSFDLLSEVVIPAKAVVTSTSVGHKSAFIDNSDSFVSSPNLHFILEVDQPQSPTQRRAHGIAKHFSFGLKVVASTVVVVVVVAVVVVVVAVVLVVVVVVVVVEWMGPPRRSNALPTSTSHQNLFAR